MDIFKRIAIVIIVALLSATTLTACGGDEQEPLRVNSIQKKVLMGGCTYVGQVLGPFTFQLRNYPALWLANAGRKEGIYPVPSIEYYDGAPSDIPSTFRWRLV